MPNICDFETDFESCSPFDMGWTLNVKFYNPEDENLESEDAKRTIRTLLEEKAFEELDEYIDRCKDDFGWNDDTELKELASRIYKELGISK